MAPKFSKPVPDLRPPGTRKRTISTALSSGDNVDATAIKKRKLAAAAMEEAARHAERQPSVEIEADPRDEISHVGRHASPGVLLEKEDYHDVMDLTGDDDKPAPKLRNPRLEEDEEDETEDEEISKCLYQIH